MSMTYIPERGRRGGRGSQRSTSWIEPTPLPRTRSRGGAPAMGTASYVDRAPLEWGLGALDLLDTPRAALTSAIQEGYDAFHPGRTASWDDFLRQADFGVGADRMGMGGGDLSFIAQNDYLPHWAKQGLGFVAEVGLDPLAWIPGKKAAGLAAKAGRQAVGPDAAKAARSLGKAAKRGDPLDPGDLDVLSTYFRTTNRPRVSGGHAGSDASRAFAEAQEAYNVARAQGNRRAMAAAESRMVTARDNLRSVLDDPVDAIAAPTGTAPAGQSVFGAPVAAAVRQGDQAAAVRQAMAQTQARPPAGVRGPAPAAAADPAVAVGAADEARRWADAGGLSGFAARRFGGDARSARGARRAERVAAVPGDSLAARAVRTYRRVPKAGAAAAIGGGAVVTAATLGVLDKLNPQAVAEGDERARYATLQGQRQQETFTDDGQSATVATGQVAQTGDGQMVLNPTTAQMTQQNALDVLAADVAGDLEAMLDRIDGEAERKEQAALEQIEAYRASIVKQFDDYHAALQPYASGPESAQVAQLLAEAGLQRSQMLAQLDFAASQVGTSVQMWRGQAGDEARQAAEERMNQATDRYLTQGALQSLEPGPEPAAFDWARVDVGFYDTALAQMAGFAPEAIETRRVLDLTRGMIRAQGDPAAIAPSQVIPALIDALEADQVTEDVRMAVLDDMAALLNDLGQEASPQGIRSAPRTSGTLAAA